MKPWLKYLLLTLLWSAVAAYVVWSATATGRVRRAQQVGRLEIRIVDSTSQGHLVTGGNVREWLRREGIATVGTGIDAADLQGIEELIARNGFVDKVRAYTTRNGTLHIDISQRRPLLRLLTDGMNAYVTASGYVFAAPRASSLYVPVVTGPYKPPFAANHTGPAGDYVAARRQRTAERIGEIEREKDTLYKQQTKLRKEMDSVRKVRTRRKWWKMERKDSFEKRVEKLRDEKQRFRHYYRYRMRLVAEEFDRIASRQEAERSKQKKLEKSYEDFMKLLTFVEQVEADDFWRSEVVQIIAHTTVSGALEVDLIPRSGRHRILFGRLERVEEKFDKLLCFYRRGLNNIGWEEYSIINIKYNDQVVCKK